MKSKVNVVLGKYGDNYKYKVSIDENPSDCYQKIKMKSISSDLVEHKELKVVDSGNGLKVIFANGRELDLDYSEEANLFAVLYARLYNDDYTIKIKKKV